MVSHTTFLLQSAKTTFDTLLQVDSSKTIYIVLVIVAFTLLGLVRNLAKFSFTFMLGIVLIAFSTIYVSIFAVKKMVDQGGIGPDLPFFEPDGYLNTLGFTIYCYEGIGIVMPVLATA